ncbi:MAG: hydroxymethylbilane synthase [Planctomyces sp.]
MTKPIVRIATRKSALALWQANHIAALLQELPEKPVTELVLIETSGDRNQTDPLQQFGGTGVFTREVQRAVLDERADVAVHSLKDLPTQLIEGLSLAAVPARAPRCDSLLLPAGSVTVSELSQLPARARIGTGSPRRKAQLLHLRSDLQVEEIRGNVDTRLRKLDEGQYDAILLAEAGLTRLGLQNRISLKVQPPLFYPAVSQGALGLECRSSDQATSALLRQLTCESTYAEVSAERSLLRTLRAGCHAPLGVWTECSPGGLSLTGVLLSMDGASRITAFSAITEVKPETSELLGITVAYQLLEAGAEQLLVHS